MVVVMIHFKQLSYLHKLYNIINVCTCKMAIYKKDSKLNGSYNRPEYKIIIFIVFFCQRCIFLRLFKTFVRFSLFLAKWANNALSQNAFFNLKKIIAFILFLTEFQIRNWPDPDRRSWIRIRNRFFIA